MRTYAEYYKAYYAKNRERICARMKRWRERNPDKWRSYQLKSTYGIDAKEQDRLLNGPCAICGKPARCIDHDHKTKQVRGGLCNRCNVGLGQFGDDKKLIQKALEYLNA